MGLDTLTSPLVSVVVPCYRYAHLLPEAVQSVLSQSYSKWELIIVDDQSPDNTAEVAQNLIAANPKHSIRLLRKKNGGAADARNTGVLSARGEFILPLDADDILDHQALEILVAKALTCDRDCVIFGSYQVFGAKQDLIKSIEYFSPERLARTNMIAYSSLYPKSLWREVGGYSTDLPGFEDWEFWIKCLARGARFIGCPEVTLRYRMSAEGNLAKDSKSESQLRAAIVCRNPTEYSPKEVLEARALLAASGWEQPAANLAPAFWNQAKSSSDQRRLAIAANYYHIQGGTETLALELFYALLEADIETHLIFAERGNALPLSGFEPVAWNDKPLVHSFKHSRPQGYSDIINKINPAGLIALVDIDALIDIVLAATPRQARKLAYLNINNQAYEGICADKQTAQRLAASLGAFDSRAIFFEGGGASKFCREYELSFEIVPNGVPNFAVDDRTILQRLNLPHGIPLLVYPGLIAPLKNQVALMQAFSELTVPHHLVFAGNHWNGTPEYSAQFEQMLKSYGKATFVGPLSRNDMTALLQAAHLCVFPSLSEGAPLTLLESMRHGLPWLATPQVEFAFQIRGGVVCDLAHFSKAAAEMLTNRALYSRLAETGRQEYRRSFDIRKCAGRLLEVLAA